MAMPEWGEMVGTPEDRQPRWAESVPMPMSMSDGMPLEFGAQVKVSENLLVDDPAAVRDLVLDDLRRAVAAEMAALNCEPIGGETLDWETDPDFFIRIYRLVQQGRPIEVPRQMTLWAEVGP
jgi:hypothetical protein